MCERTHRLASAIDGFLPLPTSGQMKVIIPRGSLLRVTPDPYDLSGSLQVQFAGKNCQVSLAVINGLESTPTGGDQGRN